MMDSIFRHFAVFVVLGLVLVCTEEDTSILLLLYCNYTLDTYTCSVYG